MKLTLLLLLISFPLFSQHTGGVPPLVSLETIPYTEINKDVFAEVAMYNVILKLNRYDTFCDNHKIKKFIDENRKDFEGIRDYLKKLDKYSYREPQCPENVSKLEKAIECGQIGDLRYEVGHLTNPSYQLMKTSIILNAPKPKAVQDFLYHLSKVLGPEK